MHMFRLLPFAALLLASGCVTDYAYHHRTDATGDYYTGTPRVEYRYYTPSGLYRSSSPYVNPGIYGYGWYRGGPSPGPYGIYGNPYWGAPYWGPPHYRYRAYGNPYPAHPGYRRRYDGLPWRNIGRPPPGGIPPPPGVVVVPPLPPVRPPPSPPIIERPPPTRIDPHERARARGKIAEPRER